MSGIEDAERELEKVEEVLAMADRMIQLSRQEQERLAPDPPAAGPEPTAPADEVGPAG